MTILEEKFKWQLFICKYAAFLLFV